MQFSLPKIYGLFLSIIIAFLAFLAAKFTGFNEVLLALILGIAIGNIVKLPPSFNEGIKIASGLFLELAIVFMAFGINYSSFIALGWQAIMVIVVTMALVLFSTVFLAKKLQCPGSTGWLVGFGTAICGSAAIAALAPSVSKDKTDIGIALTVVNLFGLLGMIAIPYLSKNLLTDMQNGVLIGASLHSVGNVAGAGFVVNEHVGELAVTVKLGRIALLTPALLIFQFFTSNTSTEKNTPIKSFKLPWYLVVFIIISILVSIFSLPSAILGMAKYSSAIFLAIAMAGIGLKVELKTLAKTGKKGILFGAIIFAIQLIAIALMMYLVY